MEERVNRYIEDKENKIFIQQKLDKIYYEEQENKSSELFRIANEIEEIKIKFPNLREVFENDRVMTLSEDEVRATLKLYVLLMEEFNEMENIAYNMGIKDTFKLLKKMDVV